MTLLFVVEGADVVCRRRAAFNNCGRFLPIPRLCLHFRPELLDQGIVVTVTENPKAESEAVFLSVARANAHVVNCMPCWARVMLPWWVSRVDHAM